MALFFWEGYKTNLLITWASLRFDHWSSSITTIFLVGSWCVCELAREGRQTDRKRWILQHRKRWPGRATRWEKMSRTSLLMSGKFLKKLLDLLFFVQYYCYVSHLGFLLCSCSCCYDFMDTFCDFFCCSYLC